MAIVTNTFQTTGAKGNREDLSDIVSMITPQDTPIYTMIDKGKARSVHPEWETDSLRAPAANAQLEGDEYSFNAANPAVRLGNYTQIFRDSWIISESQEAVDNAGNIEKVARQKMKTAINLRKDVELSIVSNSASVGGATRVSGGLPSFITTNDDRGAGGADGGFNQGTGLTVAETTGTQRAFSKALMDSVLGKAYASGANVRYIVTSPYNKQVFATFMSDANVVSQRVMASRSGKNVLIGTADIYQGPLGEVAIVPDRVMANSAATARRAFLIDPDMLSWLWLRPIANVNDVARTGDAEKGVIIGEGCLKVANEAAVGVIADLFGLTSAS